MAEKVKTPQQIVREQKEARQAEIDDRNNAFHGSKEDLKPGEVWCGRCGTVSFLHEAKAHPKFVGAKTCPHCHAPLAWGKIGEAEPNKEE